MVTPDRRRRAVVVLVDRFGVSERRACRVVGQHRSTQRQPGRPESVEDEKLRRRLRHFARRHPRLGWRKAHQVLRREGFVVNHKKIRRLWREEGLRRPPPRKNKKRRPGSSDGILLRAEHPCLGARRPVRLNLRPALAKRVEHRRRAHPRGPGHGRPPLDRRRFCGRLSGTSRRPTGLPAQKRGTKTVKDIPDTGQRDRKMPTEGRELVVDEARRCYLGRNDHCHRKVNGEQTTSEGVSFI